VFTKTQESTAAADLANALYCSQDPRNPATRRTRTKLLPSAAVNTYLAGNQATLTFGPACFWPRSAAWVSQCIAENHQVGLKNDFQPLKSWSVYRAEWSDDLFGPNPRQCWPFSVQLTAAECNNVRAQCAQNTHFWNIGSRLAKASLRW